MAKQKRTVKITPKGRVVFSHVFEPTKSMKGKNLYKLFLAFNKESTDMSDLKELVKEAIMEEWPNKEDRPKLINPIKDGDTDTDQDGNLKCEKYSALKGCWTIEASTMFKPQVVDQGMNEIDPMDPDGFYAGCYARASVVAFAYKPDKETPAKKKGVAFGLNNVMKVAEGDRLGGGTSAKQDFADVAAPESAPDLGDDDDDMFE